MSKTAIEGCDAVYTQKQCHLVGSFSDEKRQTADTEYKTSQRLKLMVCLSLSGTKDFPKSVVILFCKSIWKLTILPTFPSSVYNFQNSCSSYFHYFIKPSHGFHMQILIT